MPHTTGSKVHAVFKSMKYNRVPGEYDISTEMVKLGEHAWARSLPYVTNLFNIILKTGIFPHQFCHTNIILLHKKGDKSDINNYRPISLVSYLYKAFLKAIEYRIWLELEQPPE